MSYYSPNPHFAPDDFSEDRERLERCEAEAGRWFDALTKPQVAQYHATIAGLRGLAGPRYDRARAAAQTEWDRSTADAKRIYDMALADLMASGEWRDLRGNFVCV